MGVKIPERAEEQGETVRLKEAGEVPEERGAADQLCSLSEPSERMDSLDEAGVGNMCAEFVGQILSSDTDTCFAKKPELTSSRLEMPLPLSAAVSIAVWSSFFSSRAPAEGETVRPT